MVKLVVCDIDNTLVPKHKQPSENTIACIHKLHESGILFGLASGRHTEGLRSLANKWGIHCDVLIGMNGGELQDEMTGEHWVQCQLKKEWVKEIFEIMEPFRGLANPSCGINGIHYCREIDDAIAASIKYNNSKPPHVVKDDSEFWAQDIVKMGWRLKDARVMPLIEERVAQFPNENYYGVKTEYTMYEFNQSTADKGKTLAYFCQKHNIDLADVVAFGDMSNDVSLIKTAGCGICMENGSPDAKAVADVITEKSIEDDGWAYHVNKYLL